MADQTQKSDLIKSLQKGNLQQVTYLQDNQEAKWFVEANPKDRNVSVYDENMRKQFQGIRQGKSEAKIETQTQSDGQKQNQKETMKSSPKADDETGPKAKKKKGMTV